MLYVFYGDAQKARAKARQLLTQLSTKEPTASVVRITEDIWGEDFFLETLASQGLFRPKQLIVLDMLVRNEVAGEVVLRELPALQSSEHIVLLVEGALLKKDVTRLEKFAHKIQESVVTPIAPEQKESPFALSDALYSKNQQKIFIEIEKARLSGRSFEEITGLLFWAAKTMHIAQNAGSATTAGMKEYTYAQGLRGARVWGGNLSLLVAKLARIPHESRRSGEPGFSALTRELLPLCA